MAPCHVYLIPSPIGDRFADFSVAGLRAIERLEHLFVEAEDEFLDRLRRRGMVTDRQQVYALTDPEACVERAEQLVAAGASFGILASSGLPCFVDPGHEIIDRLLRQHLDEVQLVPLGMSSALDAALAQSGDNIQQFLFLGHVPETFSLDPAFFAHGLPVVYFVRGPAMPDFLRDLCRLEEQGPLRTRRLLLFKDIRKQSLSRLYLLEQPRADLALDSGEQVDYVAVVLQKP